MTREKLRRPHLLTWAGVIASCMLVCGTDGGTGSAAETPATQWGARVDIGRGISAILGLPQAGQPDSVIELARQSELLVYFQSPDAEEVLAVREAAEAASVPGNRVFAAQGGYGRIHLADNLAGEILVSPAARGEVSEQELLRVLHPEGKAILGEKEIVKPFPEGIDDWSHPYHGPDNNPLSTDRVLGYPYRTQFISEPRFSPMPQQTVVASGRVFKAFGNLAHRANQNAVLNTLMCVNGYNGTIPWKRELKDGFLIHRNTMVATDKTLYLADDDSCKSARPTINDSIDEPSAVGLGAPFL